MENYKRFYAFNVACYIDTKNINFLLYRLLMAFLYFLVRGGFSFRDITGNR